jgi:hypothetical protein
MEPGWAGVAITEITRVCGADAPQEFTAVTEMLPPEVPAVTEMELVVLVPDQPEGNVQL